MGLKEWLKKRPAISIRQLEKEAGVPSTTLAQYLGGTRKLPKKYHSQVLGASRKYGFKKDKL